MWVNIKCLLTSSDGGWCRVWAIHARHWAGILFSSYQNPCIPEASRQWPLICTVRRLRPGCASICSKYLFPNGSWPTYLFFVTNDLTFTHTCHHFEVLAIVGKFEASTTNSKFQKRSTLVSTFNNRLTTWRHYCFWPCSVSLMVSLAC